MKLQRILFVLAIGMSLVGLVTSCDNGNNPGNNGPFTVTLKSLGVTVDTKPDIAKGSNVGTLPTDPTGSGLFQNW